MRLRPIFARLCVLITALFGLAACSPPPSAVDLIYPSSPQTIATKLQDLGYRANIIEDNLGDPLIETAMEGLTVLIFFYGCEDNRDCKAIQFWTGFDNDGGVSADYLNGWNDAVALGLAAVNDDSVYVVHYVRGDNGITGTAFEETIRLWRLVITDFKDFLADAPDPQARGIET